MIITKDELIELEACEEGLETFVEANGESATIVEALDSNGVEDIFWYLERVDLTEKQEADLRGFAKSEALLNIELIKPYCSDTDYELILDYLKSDSLGLSKAAAAESAAWSARAAARSEREAAESAAESARAAARSEREAAESAAWSAWSAARAAARSERAAESARNVALERQAEKLKKIFEGWL